MTDTEKPNAGGGMGPEEISAWLHVYAETGSYTYTTKTRLLHASKLIRELREELIEWLWETLIEIGTELDGWINTNARTTAVYAGDRLVELGAAEKHPDRRGRVQWYRMKKEADNAAE